MLIMVCMENSRHGKSLGVASSIISHALKEYADFWNIDGG